MKLTNKDRNYLLSIGYANDDFTEIEGATRNIKYLLITNWKNCEYEIKITQKQAIEVLGREKFLSSIGRATFHATALSSPEGEPKVSIYFERKNF